MKWKKEQVILVSVIIVLAAYLLVQKSGKTHYQLPELAYIKKSGITKLELRKKDSDITLQKKGDGWVIGPEEYPADRGKTDAMVSNVAGLTLTAMAAGSGNDPVYNLDADHRIEIRAYAGNSLKRTILIGKSAPSGTHTFVKVDNHSGIYHAENDLRSVFDTTVQGLRDKTVMTVAGDVKSIVLNEGKKKLTLLAAAQKGPAEKKNGGAGSGKAGATARWKTGSGRLANDSEVDDLVGALRNLKCDDFIEGKNKKDFTSPVYAVTLKGDKTYTLSLFKEQNNVFPAVSSENKYPFHLSEWRAKRIMKEFSVLTGPK